jgi:hypothetical protein
MITLLLLAIVCGCSIQAKAVACPVFFFVIDLDTYQTFPQRTHADYGTYMLRNGSQLDVDFYLPEQAVLDVTDTYHCAILEAIVTDNEEAMEQKIRKWTMFECARLEKTPEECFRPRYDYSTAMTTTTTITEAPPTWSPTMRVVAPQQCEKRLDHTTCRLPGAECHWFDVTLGCHPVTYCDGLRTRDRCLSRKNYCHWRGGTTCVSRSL